jgi:SET domain-containing protein
LLIIPTVIKPSLIHGTGLFAIKKLLKNQIIWALHRNFDSCFSKQEWELLPKNAKKYLYTYMYWSERKQKYIGCIDNARFMNHSLTPNTKMIYINNITEIPKSILDLTGLSKQQWELVDLTESIVISTKDIELEEELVCNYDLDFPDYGGAYCP